MPFSVRTATLTLLVLTLVGASQPARLDVRLVTDEADAAMTIIDALERGGTPADADWSRLFASEGYRALQRRETAMRRGFTDSSFRAFLMSDTLRARAATLRRVLPGYRAISVTDAGQRAMRYLPAGATIRARLYPLIKPRTNTFVFTLDSTRAIYLYIDPARTAAEEQNTIAHELHHIGLATVCDQEIDPRLPPATGALLQRLHGFGEGLAMLAAAGGPDVHPHLASDSATRARWDADVAAVPRDMRLIEAWAEAALDGRTPRDSVVATAMTFYGEQGAWYTVGYHMAATVERTFGRARLVSLVCDPVGLMAAYNEAVGPAAGERRWNAGLLRRLTASASLLQHRGA